MIEIIIGKEFPQKVIPLIKQAKTSIDIIVFDWRWYPQDPGAIVQIFNQELIQAVQRGVRVRAIVNNDELANILKQNNCAAKRLLTKKLVHCKIMIIDNEIVITGSHNYTQSAFQVNYEVSLIFQGRAESKKILDFFNILYG